jgi:tRNA (cytidine/uridine-2'-O-)-methyltransferase
MRLACYQPEIAGNMGALMRLAACFGVAIDIVEPCGFVFSDARMRRAGMDYAAHIDVTRHADWTALRKGSVGRIVLLTTKSAHNLYDFAFDAADTLLLGSESAGVPDAVATSCEARLRIPISHAVRSLNIAVAAGIALGEALRQTRWAKGDMPQ